MIKIAIFAFVTSNIGCIQLLCAVCISFICMIPIILSIPTLVSIATFDSFDEQLTLEQMLPFLIHGFHLVGADWLN